MRKIALLIALFVALRLPNLFLPFTGDEVWIATTAESFAKDLSPKAFVLNFGTPSTPDVYNFKDHPPGSFVPWALFTLLPLPLEASLRLLSLLASLGTLYYAFKIAGLAAGRNAALIFLALSAVSSYGIFHQSYLIEAGGSIVALATAASFYHLLSYLKTSSWGSLAKAAVFSVAGVLSYFLAFLPLTFQSAVLFFNNRRLQAVALLAAPLLALGLLWVVVTFAFQSDYATGFLRYGSNPSLLSDAATLQESVFEKVKGLGHLLVVLGSPLAALFAVSVLSGLGTGRKPLLSRAFEPEVLVTLFVLASFLAVILLRSASDRYFSPAFPFMLVAVAVFLRGFNFKSFTLVIGAAFSAYFLALLLSGVDDYMFYSHFLYGNPLAIAVFLAPFALVPVFAFAVEKRPAITAALVGMFLAVSLYSYAFPLNNWTVAISEANKSLALDGTPLVVSKSGYLLHTAAYYDFKLHGGALSKEYYIVKLDALEKFESLPGCTAFKVHAYPLYYSCDLSAWEAFE